MASPLFKVAMSLEAEIRALEDRYGLTPAARLRLGIRFGRAARTLEDLAREVDQAEEPSELEQIRRQVARRAELRQRLLANPEPLADDPRVPPA